MNNALAGGDFIGGIFGYALAFGLLFGLPVYLLVKWPRVVLPLLAAGVLVFFAVRGFARDLGQWDNSDPAIREWYQALKQPDIPTASCCGESDAYWCDDYYARDGRAFCKVTDDRDDAPRHRPHVDVGTEIEIPANKLKWDKSNPTGHGVVFLSRGGFVYCYVQAGGA